ncbi:serine hydrolase family protein [Candidatus Gracilibacteria bacterium]|nr:serine hydrolase family protein [Candidatus Gracilibacteria bacterium]NUJ99469.1 serine hydrolase family protein [Candidatus Gracilibacteria bacterium]
MTNVFLIHGAYGHPEENWFPWIKGKLEKLGYNVFIPYFPTPKNQNLDAWIQTFKNYKKYINKDSIVIGHSLGVPFLLSFLETLEIKIKASFFISGFVDLLGNEFDSGISTFVSKKFDFEQIRKNGGNFYIFHSDNDPYVKIEQAQKLSNFLKNELILIKNAGHFNKDSGYLQFDLLFDKIKTTDL